MCKFRLIRTYRKQKGVVRYWYTKDHLQSIRNVYMRLNRFSDSFQIVFQHRLLESCVNSLQQAVSPLEISSKGLLYERVCMVQVLRQKGEVVESQFVHFGDEMGVKLVRTKLNSRA